MFKALLRWEWARLTQPRMLLSILPWSFVLSLTGVLFNPNDVGLPAMAGAMAGAALFRDLNPVSDVSYFSSRPIPRDWVILGKVVSTSLAVILIWVMTLPLGALWRMTENLPFEAVRQGLLHRIFAAAPPLGLAYLLENLSFPVFAVLGLSLQALELWNTWKLSWKTALLLFPAFVFLMLFYLRADLFASSQALYAGILILASVNILIAWVMARQPSFKLHSAPAAAGAVWPFLLLMIVVLLISSYQAPPDLDHGSQDKGSNPFNFVSESALEAYSGAAGSEKKLSVRFQYIENGAVFFASNGTGKDLDVTLRFTRLRNTDVSKPLPFRRTVPAGKEVYLLSVKQHEKSKRWDFKYRYE